MNQKPGKKKRSIIIIFSGAFILILCAIAAFLFFLAPRENPVANMSFEQCLAYTTRDVPEAKIGVVVLQDDAASIFFYGNNGEPIPDDNYEFEIGSLTKTITAALLLRAEAEGKLLLSDPVNHYMELPDRGYYPTIERLLTHQSGYKGLYLERPMIGNFFTGENSFYRVSTDMLRRRIGSIRLQDRDDPFSYSNFGFAVLGLIVEEVYQTNYTDLVNAYLKQELGMAHTRVSNGEGNLSGYWRWAENDAYIPAGALISSADDMAIYARAMLNGSPKELAKAQQPMSKINATTKQFEPLGIRLDSIGAAWIIDEVHGIVWHNGGTSSFASYLGFDPQRKIAVVVLTNLSPSFRIPATVLGVKLLTELQSQAG